MVKLFFNFLNINNKKKKKKEKEEIHVVIDNHIYWTGCLKRFYYDFNKKLISKVEPSLLRTQKLREPLSEIIPSSSTVISWAKELDKDVQHIIVGHPVKEVKELKFFEFLVLSRIDKEFPPIKGYNHNPSKDWNIEEVKDWKLKAFYRC